jgi:hypothetical protein
VDVNHFRSTSVPLNATKLSNLSLLFEGLSRETDEKIKLLTILLSKELRVSKGLGTSSIASRLLNDFDCPDRGNPFDNIIGLPGRTILDQPTGSKSLASVLVATTPTDNRFVLPFEEKYIQDAEGRKEYVPGTAYFLDSVLNNVSLESITADAYTRYATQFSNKVEGTKQAFDDLFGLREANNPLFAEKIFSKILRQFHYSTSGLTTDNDVNDVDQAIIGAILKSANTDRELKSLLLQFVVLVLGSDSTAASQRAFYEKITTGEIKTLADLSDLTPSEDHPATTVMATQTPVVLSYMAAEIAQKIASRLVHLYTPAEGLALVNSATTTDNAYYDLLQQNIIEVLTRSVFDLSTASVNLLKSLVQTLSDLYFIAGPGSFLPDNSSRTRHNFVSSTTLCFIVLEIFTSLAEKYFFADFGLPISGYDLRLILQKQKQSSIRSVYLTVSDSNNASAQPVVAGLQQSLYTIKTSLRNDALFIQNSLKVFDSINNRLTQSRSQIANFVTTNGSLLNSLITPANVSNEAQITLASYEKNRFSSKLRMLRESNHYSPFVDNFSSIDSSNQQALKLWLSQPLFREKTASKPVKLFSVGLPNGFNANLQQKVTTNQLTTTSFNDNASSVVKILIYKRMFDYPDIVFKPQQYLFDTKVFTETIGASSTLSQLVESSFKFADYSNLGNIKTGNASDIFSQGKYSFLSEAEKADIAKNHISCELLNFYVQILTGLDLCESTFLVAEPEITSDRDFQNRVGVFAKTFIQNFSTQTSIVEMVRSSNPQIASLADLLDQNSLTRDSLRGRANTAGSVQLPADLLEFLQLFTTKSFLVSHQNISKRWLTQKLFDRVFTVVVDTDDFEIDHQLTISTQSGRVAFGKHDFQDQLIRIADTRFKLKPKESSEMRFEDYFTTLELVAPGVF